MLRGDHGRRLKRLAPLAGLLFVQGCLAAAERNLDCLLAPDALENALFLPSSTIAPWVMFLIEFFA